MDATVTGEKKLNVRSERSKMYLKYIAQKMKTAEKNIVVLVPKAQVAHRYSHVFGGLAVRVPMDKLDSIANLPGVKAVYPDKLSKPGTSKSPYLIKTDKMWKTLGGQSNGGEGVIVGFIDTGIWPEHPSFSDPDPTGKAYLAPPSSWRGACEALGDCSAPIICSNKLIGAKAFLDTYKAENGGLPA